MPTVVVASDAFRGSLSSLEVADAVRSGVLDVAPTARVVVVPVADGGEGTVAAALAAGWSPAAVTVHGPTGDPVTATVAVGPASDTLPAGLGAAAHETSPGTSATPRSVLVEMADACGLGRLTGGLPAPLTASSRGLGDAILAALDLGATEVVIGVGGSASTDGGAGVLAALGARLLDADGRDLPDGGAALARLDRLDLSGLDPRLWSTRLVLAADVDSPLLGPAGAAAVFGPQKGATPHDVDVLEGALTHWSEVVAATIQEAGPSDGSTSAQPGVRASTHGSASVRMPGAGAAGGGGVALLAVLGAQRRPGVEVVLDLVGLDDALTDATPTGPGTGGHRPADLVVTGEGSLDAQTLTGKAVTGVARRAAGHGIPVVAVCGRLALDDGGLSALGVRAAYPLSALEPDPQRSVTHAAGLLRRTGRRIAQEWLSP
ncbi:MAG TPA: glycerate kinase [Ornithinibacter sp.]|nr:glycerate kinase [Ornithinibacter sp.]